MNIMILGSGGREHALAWKIKQSNHCHSLFIAPGNPGTAALGTNVIIDILDFSAIAAYCLEHHISMLVVGPEDPLVKGIYDFFQQSALQHIQVIGPSAAGAQLEGSKAFAKSFMHENNIPTAAYREFSISDFQDGLDYLAQHPMPVVIKADGLAAGKGVIIAQNKDEALAAYTDMIQHQKFGSAGEKVVIEEFLQGVECSVFVLTDGEHYTLLPSAKDYKRIGVGDTGLNTGGMGAISPVPFIDDLFMQKVIERIVEPTIQGIQRRQITYKGFIFIGLIAVQNEPYVIEYNCRLGDPETEVVLPRLSSDLVPLLSSLHTCALHLQACQISPQHAATVMLVSDGYPESYQKGKPIQVVSMPESSMLFHAGTRLINNQLVTQGGRVMAITTLSDSLPLAVEQSKNLASAITYDGKYYRSDIGYEFI